MGNMARTMRKRFILRKLHQHDRHHKTDIPRVAGDHDLHDRRDTEGAERESQPWRHGRKEELP